MVCRIDVHCVIIQLKTEKSTTWFTMSARCSADFTSWRLLSRSPTWSLFMAYKCQHGLAPTYLCDELRRPADAEARGDYVLPHRSVHSFVHCQRLSISCCSHSSGTVVRHCLLLSPSFAVILNHTSSHFLTLYSTHVVTRHFGHVIVWKDSSLKWPIMWRTRTLSSTQSITCVIHVWCSGDALFVVYICRRKQVLQSNRVENGLKAKKQRSTSVARVPRRITVAALQHFSGMRVDTESISYVEEVWV